MREYFNEIIALNDNEWEILQSVFKERVFNKGDYLVSEGKIENHVNLIMEGACRAFYIKDGIEYNYEIGLEDDWICSYKSFTTKSPSDEYIQALTDVKVYSITKDNIERLALLYPKLTILNNYVLDQIIIDKTDRLRSFVSDSPNERYLKLLVKKPALVQKIPLKYIASYIGITAESLSRLRKRILEK